MVIVTTFLTFFYVTSISYATCSFPDDTNKLDQSSTKQPNRLITNSTNYTPIELPSTNTSPTIPPLLLTLQSLPLETSVEDNTPHRIIIAPPIIPVTIKPVFLTSYPTPNPITHKPTMSDETKSPTVSPIIIQPDNAYDTVQEHNDLNNNGIDDALEFFIIPAIPILILCFAIISLLFIALIYNIHCRKQDYKKQIPNIIEAPVILTFISNFITIIAILAVVVIHMVTGITNWNQQTYRIALIPYYVSALAYAMGKFGLEFFFIFRAFHTFKLSSFALPNSTIGLLFGWSVMLLIGWFMMFYNATIHPNVPHYIYLILTGIEVIFVLTLLYVFTKRLKKLVLLHKIELSSKTPVNPSEADDELVEYSVIDVKAVQSNLSFHQMKFIFLITRCILLTGFALVTTILFGIVLFYYQQFGLPVFIGYSICAIDMVTNCICLYLNFAFATKRYRACCKFCHNGCQFLMEYSAARQILKEQVELE